MIPSLHEVPTPVEEEPPTKMAEGRTRSNGKMYALILALIGATVLGVVSAALVLHDGGVNRLTRLEKLSRQNHYSIGLKGRNERNGS